MLILDEIDELINTLKRLKQYEIKSKKLAMQRMQASKDCASRARITTLNANWANTAKVRDEAWEDLKRKINIYIINK